jgi:hypothetical protein
MTVMYLVSNGLVVVESWRCEYKCDDDDDLRDVTGPGVRQWSCARLPGKEKWLPVHNQPVLRSPCHG